MSARSQDKVQDWESIFPLEANQIQGYQQDGVVKLKHLFSAESLNVLRREVLNAVSEFGPASDGEKHEEEYPSEDLDLYRKAFTQVFNLWTHSEVIRSFVLGRLADIASKLMGVDGVRIYHDQALFKESGGVATPWHVDHYYWPLSTEKVLTAWIPLIPLSAEMGPLEFALGSHLLDYGRNIELVQQEEKITENKLAEAGCDITTSSYDLGEVSFHQGWNFHRAGANRTELCREVFTVIYMDQDMKLQHPENANQEYDRDKWCPGVEVGEVIASEINPCVAVGLTD